MNKGSFHSSGRLDVEMLINRFRLQRFVFTADSVAFPVISFTWQLNIKENVGAYTSLLTLSTGGGGLSFPVYETNIIEARFEAAQVNKPNIDQGTKYWELVRTDTNEIWISGNIEFKYGLLDSSESDQDVTVNISNDTVVVELNSIVEITTTGTGGGSGLTDWPISSGAPTGTIAQGKRYRLSGSPGVILGEAVDDGTTMEARVANPVVRADWYFNFGGT